MSVAAAEPARRALASPGAQEFIRDAPPLDLAPVTLENASARRAAVRADFAPASHRATARHHVRVSSLTIGAVACQEVRCEAQPEPDELTVLHFFGGGYVLGSPFEELPITAAIAEFAKARVLVPEYRLAPEHPFPAALEDGLAVYRALSGTLDPARFAVGGESAGGNLALGVLQAARAQGLAMPAALFLLSPWADLTHGGDSLTGNAERDPTLAPTMLEDMASAYAGSADCSDPRISPLFGQFDSAWPATIITTGTRDLLMSQSVRLARVMREAGIDADLRVWDGLWHVFEFYDTVPEAFLSLREIAGFLRQRCRAAEIRAKG